MLLHRMIVLDAVERALEQPGGFSLKFFREESDRLFLRYALLSTRGNKTSAGRMLGMGRTTLLMKAQKLKVDVPRTKKSNDTNSVAKPSDQ